MTKFLTAMVVVFLVGAAGLTYYYVNQKPDPDAPASILERVDGALRYGVGSFKTERYEASFYYDNLTFEFREMLFNEYDEFDCTGKIRSASASEKTERRAQEISDGILAKKGIKKLVFQPYSASIEKSGAYDWQELAETIFSVVDAKISTEYPATVEDVKPDIKVVPTGKYLVIHTRSKLVDSPTRFESISKTDKGGEMAEMARDILAVKGVKSVMFHPYEITIDRSEVFDWSEMQEEILAIVRAKLEQDQLQKTDSAPKPPEKVVFYCPNSTVVVT